MPAARGPTRKSFPVFDCDAHINDPYEIWSKYVEPAYRDLVRRSYWQDEKQAILNGRTVVIGGASYNFPGYNPICIAGPGMNKKVMRMLQQTPLTGEQKAYLEHRGAYDPHARLRDMDLMGIDQVLIIPTMMVANFPYVESAEGAYAFARAYNNWATDFCAAAPERLFPAGWLPLQNPEYSVAELERIAKRGFRVALVRPIDARGQYPNRIFPVMGSGTIRNTMDKVYRAFEETGIVVGMHTFPALPAEPWPVPVSPGELIMRTGDQFFGGRLVDGQTLSFIFEAMVWLSQVLLSGFLDIYPKLRMAIFESNSSWVPELLEHCDRLFKLYANERRVKTDRLPSEAFSQQCFIAFESDEEWTFRQWDRFEDVGIWSSDAYHHDGADSWSAIRAMTEVGVPVPVQAKLLGENARRLYRIDGKLFVTEEPEEIVRPDWFPKPEQVAGFAAAAADPRSHGAPSFDLGRMDPRAFLEVLRNF
jgi:predicted TIM-barrel fold metal-dependent hydrolase